MYGEICGKESPCSFVGLFTVARCVSNNIEDLNFSVSDSWPWLQAYGLDQRFDNGIDNSLPANTVCGGGPYTSVAKGAFKTPGVLFSGDTSTDFGQGDASSKDWVVGGLTYPEVFRNSNSLKTSTKNLRVSGLKAGNSLIQLSSVPGCSNPATDCNLPSNLGKGIYVTNGDIRFRRKLTNSLQSGNTYIFLAENNGNIYFENSASMIAPSGAIALFAAGRDILINRNVSAVTNSCPVPTGQLQGIFSADRNIVIEGNNGDCSLGADVMLNIDGALIANAARGGGTFRNQRDLCAGNRSYPSLTVTARSDFVMNIPGFLMQQQMVSSEVTP